MTLLLVPPPPHDPALPALPTALDGAAMAAIIASHLDDCRSGALELLECRPIYVRYKPGTSCLVQYGLTFRLSDGSRLETEGGVRLGDRDRTRELWSGPMLARTVARTARRHPGPPQPRVALIDELDAVLQLLPVDRQLPALVTLTARPSLRRSLARALTGADHGLHISRPVVVRYRPGRKALVRAQLKTQDRTVLYVKTYADDRASRVAALSTALVERCLPVARLAAVLPDVQGLAHEQAPGTRLADLVDVARFGAASALTGETLARLHAASMPSMDVAPAISETRLVRDAARTVARLIPALESRVTRLSDRIARRLDDLETRTTIIHGDFYDDQVLVDETGVTFIDFDEARFGDPRVDVADFIAHVSARWGADAGVNAREAFLDAYLGSHGRSTGSDMAGFEAAALLRMAVGPFRRLEPDWPVAIERLVSLSEEALDGTRTTGTTPLAHDEALPQIREVLDPPTMQRHLRTALGLSVDVRDVTLVRHKPGRRCTIRFDLLDAAGQPRVLFGKVYASGRAARVDATLRAFAGASPVPGLRLPHPVGCIGSLHLVLQEAVTGTPITERLLAGDTGLGGAIAAALAGFHRSGARLDRRHAPLDEVTPLVARVDRFAMELPALVDSARAVLEEVGPAIRRHGDSWRYMPIHRDLYHDNILASGDGLAFLDLDDAAMGEPAVDIANVSAHLVLLAIQGPVAREAIVRVRSDFLDAAISSDPMLDARLVRDLEVATLLRLATIHGPRRDGHKIADALLDAAHDRLASRSVAA
ncbi:MAG: phosphotransferase [Chloroflexi bacterium]|nr:phosphotransferase [Chloroflexota bacterium]